MTELLLMAGVFVFSFLIGRFLISKVPSLLHTPLMSMTNAISAVIILGALLLFTTGLSPAEKVLAAAAIVLATFNVAGGIAITDRMLRLFKDKE